jgi:hypothetical protein
MQWHKRPFNDAVSRDHQEAVLQIASPSPCKTLTPAEQPYVRTYAESNRIC